MKTLFKFSLGLLSLLILTSSVFTQEAGSSLADVLKIVGYRVASLEAGVVSSESVSFHHPVITGVEKSSTPYHEVRASFVKSTSSLDITFDASKVFSDLLANFDMEIWDKVSQFSSIYIYDGERYRRTFKFTPVSEMETEMLRDANDSRFTQIAFDGVFQFALSNREMRVDFPDGLTFGQGPAEWPLLLMRWDLIPEQNLVRDDQELRTGYLDEDRYEYTLINKETNEYTEQIFNTSTGLVERVTGFDSNGQVIEETIWAAPRRHPSGIWTPVFYLHARANVNGHYSVTMKVYNDWDVRPVDNVEFAIPSSDYDVIRYASRTGIRADSNLQDAISLPREEIEDGQQRSETTAVAVVTSTESLNGPNPTLVTSGGEDGRGSPFRAIVYLLGGFVFLAGIIAILWPKHDNRGKT